MAVRELLEPFQRGAAPEPQPATGFYTDTTVCIGCKACEVACKQWNQLPADGFAWLGESYDNTGALSATSWRHVKFIEQFPDDRAPATDLLDPGRWLMMSDVCKHCVTAPCQQACPTGARKFGNVLDPRSEVSEILRTKRVFVLKEEVGTLPRFFYYFDERYPNTLDPEAAAIAARLREEEGDAYGCLPGPDGPRRDFAVGEPQRWNGARA